MDQEAKKLFHQEAKRLSQNPQELEWSKVRCFKCRKSATLRCQGCFTVKYCSKECQNDDWGTHKQECKMIGKSIQIAQELKRKELALTVSSIRFISELAKSSHCFSSFLKTLVPRNLPERFFLKLPILPSVAVGSAPVSTLAMPVPELRFGDDSEIFQQFSTQKLTNLSLENRRLLATLNDCGYVVFEINGVLFPYDRISRKIIMYEPSKAKMEERYKALTCGDIIMTDSFDLPLQVIRDARGNWCCYSFESSTYSRLNVPTFRVLESLCSIRKSIRESAIGGVCNSQLGVFAKYDMEPFTLIVVEPIFHIINPINIVKEGFQAIPFLHMFSTNEELVEMYMENPQMYSSQDALMKALNLEANNFDVNVNWGLDLINRINRAKKVHGKIVSNYCDTPLLNVSLSQVWLSHYFGHLKSKNITIYIVSTTKTELNEYFNMSLENRLHIRKEWWKGGRQHGNLDETIWVRMIYTNSAVKKNEELFVDKREYNDLYADLIDKKLKEELERLQRVVSQATLSTADDVISAAKHGISAAKDALSAAKAAKAKAEEEAAAKKGVVGDT